MSDKIYIFFIIMGYHPSCFVSNCIHNCCNFGGTCPSTSSGCVHYYYGSENKNNGGTIGGAVAGAIFGVIILIIIACYCYKKRQSQHLQEQMQMQMANNNQHEGTTIIIPGNTAQPAPYGAPGYGQPMYGQPAYGQPAYGQQPAYYNAPPQQQIIITS